MAAAQGILTVRGGMTSHAAVVARGMGTCCVSGCGEIKMDEARQVLRRSAARRIHEGDCISIWTAPPARSTAKRIPTVDATISGDFGRFMAWADEYRSLSVRTNADTPRDAKQAVEFGAEGIGLCRTEHMFFEARPHQRHARDDRAPRPSRSARRRWPRSLPYQQGDFEAMYEAHGGPPGDHPLPRSAAPRVPAHQRGGHRAIWPSEMKISVEKLKDIIASLHEFNPMMGHRGCRLAVTYPGDRRDADHAPSSAPPSTSRSEHPEWNIVPEIMIPLVGEVKELKFVKDVVVETADRADRRRRHRR